VITVNALELNALMEQEPALALLNVRPTGTAHEGWLPGSRHLPQAEIALRAASLLPDKEQPVAVYGADIACEAASRAAATLEQMGYRRVYELSSGLKGWKQAGFRLIFRN
jgi:rhodanese-related sulfurtransferase